MRRLGTCIVLLAVLATATTASVTTPAAADLGTGATSAANEFARRIALGDQHSCVIVATGDVKCWGAGSWGRLGYGNTNSIGDNEHPSTVGTVDLGTGRTAVAITAGSQHTCAILDTGAVRCWGANFNGQQGQGNTSHVGDDELPSSLGTVPLGSGRTATQIVALSNSVCAILDNSTVRCWGFGSNGALGNGATADIGDNEAVDTGGLVDLGGDTAIALSGGEEHACAIVSGGNVRCWGWALGGQLGYGNTNNIGDNESVASAGTVNLGGATALAISSGREHNCVILSTGAVKCWGNGSSGGLGYGNTNNIGDNETPAAVGNVDLGSGRTAVAISVGNYMTCAVLDNGTVRCWGQASNGQLGLGNTSAIGDDESPSSVGSVSIAAGRSIVGMNVGTSHVCVLLDNGDVRCWGQGSSGRLGLGNTNTIGDNELPSTVAAVALGGSPPSLTASANSPTVAEGTPSATVTVTLSQAAPWPLSVSYSTVDGTATVGTDYTAASGSLSFAVGETTKTFAVPVTADATAGESDETLSFTLTPTPTIAATAGTVTITNVDPAPTAPAAPGYWMLGSNGSVYAFGSAPYLGNGTGNATDVAPTPSGNGYWILHANGTVSAHGDATTHAATSATGLTGFEFAAAIAATASGNGYWVFTSYGRVLTYGDATAHGDLSDDALHAPIVDAVALNDGNGYYLAGADGGVFAFDSATFSGSLGGTALNAPIESLTLDPDGTG